MPAPPELAVVTGAARGIGAATAMRLARTHRALILVDVPGRQPGATYAMAGPEELEAVAVACRQAGAPAVEVLQADAGRPAFTSELVTLLDGRHVGAAVAAAGIIAGGPGWATDEDIWETVIGSNLHGTRRLAEATVPSMLTAGDGRFVAVASAAALRSMPLLAAYSAAKAAVAAFVCALASDLADTGVTANVVCPGSTRGAMLQASATVYDLPDQDAFGHHQLLRRLLEPDEIAAAITWLCGPDATAMTGAVIPVDGGLSS